MAGNIKGIYGLYKDDTTTFLTWLVETAQSRGYQLPTKADEETKAEVEPSAPRPKGKARKLAREAASQRSQQLPQPSQLRPLGLNVFTSCAETVANARDPAVVIAPDLLAVANRALSLRKRCTNWFARQKQASEDTVRGNRRHRYFNHWLEDIILMLRPCSDAFVAEAEVVLPDHRDLNNRFASLEVEEPSLESMASRAADATRPSPSLPGHPKSGTLYTTENDDEEKYLAIFCLYEDLNRIRRQICKMWTQYRLGRADLISVSLATSVALELATEVEAEFLDAYPEMNTASKIIIAMLSILQASPGDSSTFSIQAGAGGTVKMSMILMEWLLIPTTAACEGLWQLPLDYLVTFSLANTQEMSDKVRGMSSTPSDASALDGNLRMLTYLKDLISIAAEVAVLQVCNQTFPVEDMFTQSLRAPERAAYQPLSVIFMSQAFLDIREIMGHGVTDSFDEMLRFRDEFLVDRRASDDKPHVDVVLDNIRPWMETDPILALKERLWQQVPRAKRPALRAQSSPAQAFKVFREHPLLCGLTLFDWRVALQEAALEDANQRISILSCAHLYNAVCKAKLLRSEWEDLEHVLSAHRQGEFFLGSRPERLDAFARQWAMVNGLSAAFFSKESARRLQNNPGTINAELLSQQKKDRRALRTPTPLALALADNYRSETSTSFKRLGLARPNASSVLVDYAQRMIQGQGIVLDKACIKSGIASFPLELKIGLVQAGLAKYECRALAFDYARMHQRCCAFLRTLLPLLEDVQEVARASPQDSTNGLLVHSLFMLEGLAAMARGLASDSAHAPGVVLGAVSQRMEDLIKKEGSLESDEARSRLG